MKKINLFVLPILLVLLCSCAVKNPPAGAASPSASIPAATQSTAPNPENTGTSGVSATASSQDAQWPDEFKGKLPTPVCKITNVTRYDEKSMSGKLTIVNFSEMSKADAEKYVEALKSMGFSGGVTLSDSEKIVFSGVGKDASAKNGVNFMYSVSDRTGTISY